MSRALRRHHRRRIIAKHVRQYRELIDAPLPPIGATTYVGCQRPRCGVCHLHKLDHIDRRRAEREWRRIEEVAW